MRSPDRRAPALSNSRVLVLATAVWCAACGSSTDVGDADTRGSVRIEAATPTELVGTVGVEVAPVPAVRVTDERGLPLAGILVSFLHQSVGAIANSSALTDADGIATVGRWTLGTSARIHVLGARVAGQPEVIFTALAMAGAPAQMARVSGDNQQAPMQGRVAHPLLVRVADAFGNPTAGVPVVFSVIGSGGSIENNVSATNAIGIAESGTWTLGAIEGVQQAKAELGNIYVVFSATAVVPLTGLTGRIAFTSDRSGTSQIYTVNADGSALRQLTNSGINDAPAWSPDGSRIAFASHRDGKSSIYVMDADGSNLTQRTNGRLIVGGAHDMAWSPDGSAIAFTTLHLGNSSIATVGSADTTIVLLTNTPGFNSQPSWSPDGRQLAFVSDREAYDFVFNIYTMNADGSAVTLRTQGFAFWPSAVHNLHPTWSPDGTMIAYVYGAIVNNTFMRFTVAVMSADGVFIKDLAWAGDTGWMNLLDPGALTWSPDGLGIAFTFIDCNLIDEASCPNTRSVKYVSLDRGRQGTLVSDARDPSWRR